MIFNAKKPLTSSFHYTQTTESLVWQNTRTLMDFPGSRRVFRNHGTRLRLWDLFSHSTVHHLRPDKNVLKSPPRKAFTSRVGLSLISSTLKFNSKTGRNSMDKQTNDPKIPSKESVYVASGLSQISSTYPRTTSRDSPTMQKDFVVAVYSEYDWVVILHVARRRRKIEICGPEM